MTYAKNPSRPERSCKARGSDLRVSFKNTRETAMSIRGLPLRRAQRFLRDVVKHKQAVVFHRFNSGVGRAAMAKQYKGKTQCRWPEKSCRYLQDLLTNAAANAEAKGLNPDNMFIEWIQVNAAQNQRRRTYRAHGRINAYMSNPCHVEIILTESETPVSRPQDIARTKKVKKVSKKKEARERMRSGMTVGGD
mmetsp:Transcript_2230/g.3182  ORF Transcript_2230/g.3182 Transcript_2230/m.3182 type:complete len:192 (+) Transcript_2230:45-620(+)|eukprot:CAMPEP_0171456478 /NCGR_PEP_ID=MMETSP0945-20130129/2945_1 /TAXON_ID=109269 /ORGANISM="Vaucheria litorea, Strain CCMP2940" /LENGTH=191 /DNA_ID=CAMNT_0011981903 /DNA_START=43 /DNA_END=618 /DNA_ORIENTATION=+